MNVSGFNGEKRTELEKLYTAGSAGLNDVSGFSPEKKAELEKLYRVGNSIRTGLSNIETLISTQTGDDTRDLLHEAEHTMAEVEETVGNGALYYLGTVPERDSNVIHLVESGPRRGFIERAESLFEEAEEEGQEAFEILEKLSDVRTDNKAFQVQVSRARFQLQAAMNNLASFDRTGWEDSVPPASTKLFQDQVWQARQYSYDTSVLINNSYVDGPIFPQGMNRGVSEVLSRVWLFTDKIMAASFRAAGVTDDAPDFILKGLMIDAPQFLHVVQVALSSLYTVASERDGSGLLLRPSFSNSFPRTMIKATDAWRHLDHLIFLWIVGGLGLS